jgi:hypothetical protein
MVKHEKEFWNTRQVVFMLKMMAKKCGYDFVDSECEQELIAPSLSIPDTEASAEQVLDEFPATIEYGHYTGSTVVEAMEKHTALVLASLLIRPGEVVYRKLDNIDIRHCIHCAKTEEDHEGLTLGCRNRNTVFEIPAQYEQVVLDEKQLNIIGQQQRAKITQQIPMEHFMPVAENKRDNEIKNAMCRLVRLAMEDHSLGGQSSYYPFVSKHYVNLFMSSENGKAHDNSQHKYAVVDEDEYNRGYGDGYRDATNEAKQEIRDHYHPNK